MMRMIMITFAGLGWAWFEMSGGSEFEAGSNGIRVLAKVEQLDLPAQQPQVTRAINVNTDLAVAPAAAPVAAQVAEPKPVLRDPTRLTIAAPEKVETVTQAAAAVVTQASVIAEPADYRVVSGNRVNMRNGPSTTYPVVTKLSRGDEVEVLQTSDNGWVKLRALDGNDIGWMSEDFLKVASN